MILSFLFHTDNKQVRNKKDKKTCEMKLLRQEKLKRKVFLV
jgi:hypothetical protein